MSVAYMSSSVQNDHKLRRRSPGSHKARCYCTTVVYRECVVNDGVTAFRTLSPVGHLCCTGTALKLPVIC